MSRAVSGDEPLPRSSGAHVSRRDEFVAFVERWYVPLRGAAPLAHGAGRRRVKRLDRAFAEVYRLRHRLTTEAERVAAVASMLGESCGDSCACGQVGSTGGRAAAGDVATRLVWRARRRQVVVSIVISVPILAIVAVEVLARR